MTDEQRGLIADYTEFILMGYDKGMRISMANVKNDIEKKKVEMIYKQFMSSLLTGMEAYCDLKDSDK